MYSAVRNQRSKNLCTRSYISIENSPEILQEGILRRDFTVVVIFTLHTVVPQPPVKARSCDGQVLHLSCALYEVGYITIEGAFYGRITDGTLCPHNDSSHVYDQSCSATRETVKDLVESLCKERRNCDVDVEQDILNALKVGEGDPCPGGYKYLEVEYSCNKFISGRKS